jgi:hypothetical protein
LPDVRGDYHWAARVKVCGCRPFKNMNALFFVDTIKDCGQFRCVLWELGHTAAGKYVV